SYLEKFYHHLFRSDKQAIALVEELGLGDKLVWPKPVTSTLVGGEMHRLDSPRSVLEYTPLPMFARLRLAAALAYLKIEPNYHRLEGTTADAWLRRWMGKKVYETLWKPLLRSKFGNHYQDIVMSWFWARIHLRSSALGYIRGGFQQLYNALVARVESLGGSILFGAEVREIRPGEDGKLMVSIAGEETFQFDQVVSTLPTRLTIKLTPELQGEYSESFSNIESFGAHCLILLLNRQLTDVYWLNVNDPGYPFLALVEHTNYMPSEDYGGNHVVYLGNYLPMDHPLFATEKDEIVAQYVPAIQRINPQFDASWITGSYSFKAPFAQPIVTKGYADRLPPHATPVPGLYVANMSQVYPQDRGQNYSIAMANALVARLPGDSRR
ncbi:MAG: NAD(P)/FAD-dependent oxidoreductase, partial [Chloroflexota bacterium]